MTRRALDTSDTAAAIQAEIHRRMSGAERVRLAIDMSLTARALARARLWQEHPEWSSQAIERELVRLAFGPRALPTGYK